MNDDDDDWDPAVESVLDYASRKTRQRSDGFGESKLSSGHQQEALSAGDFVWPAVSDPWYLQSLANQLLHTVDAGDHRATLQALATFFAEEAERLHAAQAFDFHRSYTLH